MLFKVKLPWLAVASQVAKVRAAATDRRSVGDRSPCVTAWPRSSSTCVVSVWAAGGALLKWCLPASTEPSAHVKAAAGRGRHTAGAGAALHSMHSMHGCCCVFWCSPLCPLCLLCLLCCACLHPAWQVKAPQRLALELQRGRMRQGEQMCKPALASPTAAAAATPPGATVAAPLLMRMASVLCGSKHRPSSHPHTLSPACGRWGQRRRSSRWIPGARSRR